MTEPRELAKIRDFSALHEPVIPADKAIPGEFVIETVGGPVRAELDFHYGEGWVEETVEHTITLKLAVQGEVVANYDCVMNTERHPPVFNLRHRIVQNNFRGRGLGTLGLQVIHEAVQNYVAKYLPGRCQGITMNVGQPALTRLVIDQNWLDEQGLSDYKRSDGVNLGYRPSRKKDVEIIVQQLRAISERSPNSYAATAADYLVNPGSDERIRAELIRPIH